MPASRELTPLEKDLIEVLNKHSIENYSNTPDFALAVFLVDCLNAYNKTLFSRESWYKREVPKDIFIKD